MRTCAISEIGGDSGERDVAGLFYFFPSKNGRDVKKNRKCLEEMVDDRLLHDIFIGLVKK